MLGEGGDGGHFGEVLSIGASRSIGFAVWGSKYIGAGWEPRAPYGDAPGGRSLHWAFDGGIGGMFDYQ